MACLKLHKGAFFVNVARCFRRHSGAVPVGMSCGLLPGCWNMLVQRFVAKRDRFEWSTTIRDQHPPEHLGAIETPSQGIETVSV